MSDSSHRFPHELVKEVARNVYAAMGAMTDEVPILVDQIMDATLRGHPGQGQGIEKLPRLWDRFKGGTIVPGAKSEVLDEGPVWVHLDARKGWGQVAAARAMDMAAAKAAEHDLGMAAVKRSNHYGTSGYYAMRALAVGAIGLAMTNAGPEMAPWGGITPILGTTLGYRGAQRAVPAGAGYGADPVRQRNGALAQARGHADSAQLGIRARRFGDGRS